MVLPTGLRKAIIPEKLQKLFSKMAKGNKALGEVCFIGVGIQESSHRGSKTSKFVSDEMIDDTYKRVLKGRELKPFKINWAGKYIHYGPHLTYAGKPEIFQNPKILYQNIRNEKLQVRLVAALDDNQFYPKNSISFIANPKPPFSLEYVLGIFNSNLVNAWFSGMFHSFHITVTQVRQIPIPRATKQLRKVVEDTVGFLRLTEESEEYETLMRQLDVAVFRCFFSGEILPGAIEDCHKFLEQASKV